MAKRLYSDEAVATDVRDFFLDPDHRLYKRFDPTPDCGPDSPYARKQLEVLFEDDYYHWLTDRAVNSLLHQSFLKQAIETIKGTQVHFVYRQNIRYIRRPIRERIHLIGRYTDPTISKATGDYAEILFSLWLRTLGFAVVAKDSNTFKGRTWTNTGHDLDYIIEKDGLGYGVEIKNTFPYIEDYEFTVKIKMCEYLQIYPLFILRNAPSTQIDDIRDQGLILRFKTKVFPPGQEELARQMWKLMRLPVKVTHDIPANLENVLLSFHARSQPLPAPPIETY